MKDLTANFSDAARRVIARADVEARQMKHAYIGTEHLLLALLQEETSIEAEVLQSFGLDADRLRREIESLVQRGPAPVGAGTIPFTPRGRHVLERAKSDAMLVCMKQVGTENLLPALLCEPDGVAARAMRNLGLTPAKVWEESMKFRLGQMKIVERVVRPLRATTARKRRMREELLAHLTGLYEEELARSHDSSASLREAENRFGNPEDLCREFQRNLPAKERRGYVAERFFGWRAPESAAYYMWRMARLTFLILAAGCIIPAVIGIASHWDTASWLTMSPLAACLILAPLAQFLHGLLYFKTRDAVWGVFGTRKSRATVALLALLSIASITVIGGAFSLIADRDLAKTISILPIFPLLGLLAAVANFILTHTRGPIEIGDAIWACLDVKTVE